jgi:hypothetical protein
MKSARIALVAAVMATGSFAFAQDARRGADNTANGRAGDQPVQNTQGGDTVAEQQRRVGELFATISEAALTKDGFNNVVLRLYDADRNRIGQFKPTDQQMATLNGRIDQIQRAWKAKYNDDFDVHPEVAFANNNAIKVMAGRGNTDNDNARLAGDRDANNNQGTVGDRAGNAVDRAVTDNPNDIKNRAVAIIPASHGLPEARVNLAYEDGAVRDSWRVDVPDSVTGEQLYNNLLGALTKIGESSNQWPADGNEAVRLVNHQLMLAITGQQK